MIKIDKREQLLRIVDEQKREWYQHPTKYTIRKEPFLIMSSKAWAIDEVDLALRKWPDLDPYFILNDLANDFRSLSVCSPDIDTQIMYAAGVDVVQGIIDTMRAMSY